LFERFFVINIQMNELRNIYLVLIVMICMLLSGCWAAFAGLGARAGLTEAMTLSVARGVATTELAMARVAQANIGSVAVADSNLLRTISSRPLSIEMRGASGLQKGSIVQTSSGIDVNLAGNTPIRVLTEKRGLNGIPGISKHFSGNKLVSYTRYSVDGKRLDFFMLNQESQGFERVMYGLRDPTGRNVAFFGVNHSYLGRAAYRDVATLASKNSANAGLLGAASVASLLVEYEDHPQTSSDQKCSEELILLKKTYFNTGYYNEGVLQFWASFYQDCPRNSVVRDSFQQAMYIDIVDEQNKAVKINKINNYKNLFPESQDARGLLESLQKGF
jgi:hypothetical protein